MRLIEVDLLIQVATQRFKEQFGSSGFVSVHKVFNSFLFDAKYATTIDINPRQIDADELKRKFTDWFDSRYRDTDPFEKHVCRVYKLLVDTVDDMPNAIKGVHLSAFKEMH